MSEANITHKTSTVYKIGGSITGNGNTFELSPTIEYNIEQIEVRYKGELIHKGPVNITVDEGVINIENPPQVTGEQND